MRSSATGHNRKWCLQGRLLQLVSGPSDCLLTKATKMQLLTPRLVLRPWMESDKRPFAAMSEDTDVMQYLRPLATRGASDAWIDYQISHQSSHGFCMWAVESRGSGTFIGAVGLMRIGFVARFTPAVEVGWRLATQFWGQGFAVEAAQASLQFGFEQICLKEIVAHASIRNVRSRHLMTRLGMSHDIGEDFDHPRISEADPLRRQVLYRLTREVWVAQRT